MENKIIHIMKLDKFNASYINFIKETFKEQNHQFIFLHKEKYEYGLTKSHDVVWINNKFKVFYLLKELYNSDKIIIHGLWISYFTKLLFLQPWLLNKCYHVMWGGDFYFPNKQKWIKKQVIKRMGHFITYIKGDYDLVKKWYGSKGKYHECFMYHSNLYKEYNVSENKSDVINIQLGNSAKPTNNHIEVLEKLLQYKEQNIRIYVPLSYGSKKNMKKVIIKGKELFGEKFIPIIDFMNYEKYLDFLGQIDIAIFAHNRQQGMGNIITLLGLGKKVYLRKDVSSFKLFKSLNVDIYSIEKLELNKNSKKEKEKNSKIISNYFNEENFIKQLREIFN